MYSYSLGFVVVVIMVALSRANPVQKCVPPQKGFHYEVPCKKYPNKPMKIHVDKIVATQDGISVDRQGGLDLTRPLSLAFNLTYSGSHPIKSHRMDQGLKKYVPDSNGDCNWEEVDTAGVTDDLDACELIKNDCAYATHMRTPKQVTTTINWTELFGEGVSALHTGTYYGFETVERDGSEIINCFWIQAKILKTPASDI